MTFTQIDEYPDGSYGPVRVVDANGRETESSKEWRAFTVAVSQQMLDDFPAITDPLLYAYRESLLDERDGPRLGPGREEWQRYKRKPIATAKHWGPDKVPRSRRGEGWDW